MTVTILDRLPIKVIRHVVLLGVNLSFETDGNGVPYINFNTGMKSHLHLYFENGKYVAKCRYNDQCVIDCWNDLHWQLTRCYLTDHMSDNIHRFYKEGFINTDFEWEEIDYDSLQCS